MNTNTHLKSRRTLGIIGGIAALPLYVAISGCAADPTEDGAQQQSLATESSPEQQSLSEVMASGKFEIPAAKLQAMEDAARVLESGGPIAQHAACGRSGPNLDHAVHADAPASGAVNQRNGTIAVSSTNCPILGVLQPTDDAEYFCWTTGNDGFTWSFTRSIRTGVRGWSRDNLLDNFGAINNCGF